MSRFLPMLVIAALAPLLLRWVMRTAQNEAAAADPATGAFTMKQGRGQRRLINGSFAVIALGVIWMFYFVYPFWKIAVIFGGVMVVPFGLGVYSLRRRVRILDGGLESRSPWTGTTFAKWSDIEAVHFRGWGKTIRLKLTSGKRIVIPCSFTGTAVLEARMRENLPSQVLGDTFENYRAYVSAL
jgi:hypothetical protein